MLLALLSIPFICIRSTETLSSRYVERQSIRKISRFSMHVRTSRIGTDAEFFGTLIADRCVFIVYCNREIRLSFDTRGCVRALSLLRTKTRPSSRGRVSSCGRYDFSRAPEAVTARHIKSRCDATRCNDAMEIAGAGLCARCIPFVANLLLTKKP